MQRAKALRYALGVLAFFGLVAVTLPTNLLGALTSQVNSYVNGNVLTAGMLNSEFANIYSTINALDNANLISSANISPSKISGTIDGDGISRNGGTGALSASVDGSTIEILADQIRIKDSGVTATKLAADSVTTPALQNSAVTNAKIAADAITGDKIAPNSVVTSDITDNAITKTKIEAKTNSPTAAVGQVALSNSSGLFTGTSGDITNLTVTITTHGGPVVASAVPSGDNGPGFFGYFSTDSTASIDLVRDGTVVAESAFASAGGLISIPAGMVQFFNHPGTGTYVYKLRVSGGPSSFTAAHVRLMVYEL